MSFNYTVICIKVASPVQFQCSLLHSLLRSTFVQTGMFYVLKSVILIGQMLGNIVLTIINGTLSDPHTKI